MDALPCMNMALKTTQVFLTADGEASWFYFQVGCPCYQVSQCDQKTPIPVSSRLQVRSEKAKKV